AGQRDADLEAYVARDDSLAAQRFEDEIGVDPIPGVAQPPSGIAECHLRQPWLDAKLPLIGVPAGPPVLDAVDRIGPPHGFEIRMTIEDPVALKVGPPETVANLPVRQAKDVIANRLGASSKNFFGGFEGHTPEQHQVPVYSTHDGTL